MLFRSGQEIRRIETKSAIYRVGPSSDGRSINTNVGNFDTGLEDLSTCSHKIPTAGLQLKTNGYTVRARMCFGYLTNIEGPHRPSVARYLSLANILVQCHFPVCRLYFLPSSVSTRVFLDVSPHLLAESYREGKCSFPIVPTPKRST